MHIINHDVYNSESGIYSVVNLADCECALVISSRMCHHFKWQKTAPGQTDSLCANETQCSSRLMAQSGIGASAYDG